MSITAIIPVKSPADAKSRLADFLPEPDRVALAWSLFRNVLAVTAEVIGADNIIVVSADGEILEQAEKDGARCCRESPGAGLNAALEQAAQGISGPVLALHADLPLIEGADIVALTAAANDHRVVIAPDRQGTGTNALLLERPGLIPFNFGDGSCQAHCAAATDAGIAPHVMERDGLAFDLDTRADYLDLTRRGKP